MNKRGIDLPDNISILRISGTGMTIVTCFLMSVKKGTWNNRKKDLEIQAVQAFTIFMKVRKFAKIRFD